MPTYIKSGYWEKSLKAPKNHLDLERLIRDNSSSVSLTNDQVSAISSANAPTALNPFATINDLPSGGSINDVTYAELVAAIGANELVPGSLYRITDFQTVHYFLNGEATITTAINTGSVEPLIVLAISESNLAHNAYSELHPRDIIEYDWNPANFLEDRSFSNANTIVSGFKGVITYREDTEFNNSAYFDIRNVKCRRWKPIIPEWNAATNYGATNERKAVWYDDAVFITTNKPTGNLNKLPWGAADSIYYWNGYIDDDAVPDTYWYWKSSFSSVYEFVISNLSINAEDYQDILAFSSLNNMRNVHIGKLSTRFSRINNIVLNAVYADPEDPSDDVITNIIIEDDCYNMTLDGSWLQQIKIGQGSYDITINTLLWLAEQIELEQFSNSIVLWGYSESVKIGQGSYDIILSGTFWQTIGNNCANILSAYWEQYITIGDHNRGIDIYRGCEDIETGNRVQDSSFIGSYYCYVGTGSENVLIRDSCTEIVISGPSWFTKIGEGCEDIEIGPGGYLQCGDNSYGIYVSPYSYVAINQPVQNCNFLSGSITGTFISGTFTAPVINNLFQNFDASATDFSTATHIYATYPCEFTSAADGAKIVKYIASIAGGLTVAAYNS